MTDEYNHNLDKNYKTLQSDYLTTFNTKEGERVLEDLKKAYYHRTSFNSEPYTTAFNEGQRAVVIRIINLITKESNDE
tara:strand:+ start:346 stop:579 length:234 start_codon:yes stop_codon:yes gene_type:complete